MRSRTGWFIALGLMVVCAASAQTYPNKPIKFVVGYPPGGSGDFVTRTIGEAIATELGQSAVIDNRPGAAGNLASEIVNKSPADGYTLLVGGNPYINKALYKKLSYDIEKDFQPITLLGNGPMVIAVNSGLPVHNLKELIAYAKKNPDKLNFGSSGTGSAPAVQSLIAGDTQVIFGTSPVVLPQVRGGRVRPLAITTQERSAAIPNIMGMNEAGLADYNISFSFGLYAPMKTPPDDVKKIFDAAVKVLKRQDIREKLATQGMDPLPNNSPNEFRLQNQREAPMWNKLIEASGAKVD